MVLVPLFVYMLVIGAYGTVAYAAE